ncbi:hypothetical protein CSE899_11642 [Cronobacter sakazakii E899]|nr:hypothetical protein CSE899_11642 [Cronobacter sakazakii E899]
MLNLPVQRQLVLLLLKIKGKSLICRHKLRGVLLAEE